MDKINRQTLVNLGGAPSARFAIFNPDGSLYCCADAKLTENDDEFWRAGGYSVKEVVDA